MLKIGHLAIVGMLLLAFAPPAVAQFAPPVQPEAASGLAARRAVVAKRQMVVAANPLATEAGLDILNAGGSAVDAAIAVQLVLNVVEPQSSGLGGGAFLLHWNQQAQQLKSYDGREAAPITASPTQFLKPDGTAFSFKEAVLGGVSTGVPGAMQLMETAYRAHGKLPWAQLFERAIRLAEDGFPVSPRLAALIASENPENFDAAARAYLFDPLGKPLPVGYPLKNIALAATLRKLAEGGATAFYDGPIAEQIVRAVAAEPLSSGMKVEDLSAYKAKERPPVCTLYRKHRVCSMGPPSSGALTVGATLSLLEAFDLGSVPMTPKALHLIAEAEKLAYADRDQFIGDPDVVPVPAGMIDPAYLASRRALINPEQTMTRAVAGSPPGLPTQRTGLDATREVPGTSHFSIIDADGNAVAMTTTIESAFGSHRMAAGFLLNNQLTDFSFRPLDDQRRVIANAVAPGKRPRSSMAPTIVFAPDGKLLAVVGSAGGSAIILHVVKAIVGIIDWRLDAQETVDLPNFGSRNGPFEIENKVSGELIGLKMTLYGHRVVNNDAPSGLHVIIVKQDGQLEGGADARREGAAKGN